VPDECEMSEPLLDRPGYALKLFLALSILWLGPLFIDSSIVEFVILNSCESSSNISSVRHAKLGSIFDTILARTLGSFFLSLAKSRVGTP
jgi:hypothetical protein